jgi:hypothetical protein
MHHYYILDDLWEFSQGIKHVPSHMGGVNHCRHVYVEGIKNQKFRKQKLGLMDVEASRLDIYKTMWKVLRPSIRDRVSTNTSKMDSGWTANFLRR